MQFFFIDGDSIILYTEDRRKWMNLFWFLWRILNIDMLAKKRAYNWRSQGQVKLLVCQRVQRTISIIKWEDWLCDLLSFLLALHFWMGERSWDLAVPNESSSGENFVVWSVSWALLQQRSLWQLPVRDNSAPAAWLLRKALCVHYKVKPRQCQQRQS